MANFGPRGDATAEATWEFKNLGLGATSPSPGNGRRMVTGANARIVECNAQSRRGRRRAKVAHYHLQTLEVSQQAIRQAIEMFSRWNVVVRHGRQSQPIRRVGTAARDPGAESSPYAVSAEVIEYNRAQFRLYTAMDTTALRSARRHRPDRCPRQPRIGAIVRRPGAPGRRPLTMSKSPSTPDDPNLRLAAERTSWPGSGPDYR